MADVLVYKAVKENKMVDSPDVFSLLSIPLIANNVSRFGNAVFITNMVSFGSEIWAVVGRKLVIHSKDEGETWKLTNIKPAAENNSAWNWYNPFLLIVDEYGRIGPVGGVYCVGTKYISTPTAGNVQAVWYKAPGQDDFTETLSPLEEYIGEPSGVALNSLGLMITSRKSGRVAGITKNKGMNWTKYTFTAQQFDEHVHDIWASPLYDTVYVSGGDSPEGVAGVYKTTDFVNWSIVIPEYPGYRVVPVWGNQRERYFGGEGAAGSVVLATRDDVNTEVRFGKHEGDFLNFNALKTSDDGLMAVGTYTYDKQPTAQISGHGGSVLVSRDFGITYSRIRVPHQKISGITFTKRFMFVGGGYTDGAYTDYQHVPYIMRYPKNYLNNLPLVSKVCKPSWLLPRYAYGVPRCKIQSNAYTLTVNMSAYKNLYAVLVIAEAGSITIEGRIFDDDESQGFGGGSWHTLVTKTYTEAKNDIINLKEFEAYSWFRVKNTGSSPLEIREALFIGSLN